jgi:uncharacterized membrane protein YgcG
MPGTGYGDRRRDRSEGTIRVGSVWPIATETVTPVDELLLDAAMRCDIDEVDAAIGAKANATADGPLLLAAQHGGTLVVERLSTLGASVNSAGAYGKTPLILAAEKGHSDVIDALVKSGASLDARMTPGGQTALHLVGADEQCPLQMARMCAHSLLERNADPLIRDQWGRTAEEYHRRRADLPDAGGAAAAAPRAAPRATPLWTPARGRDLQRPAPIPRGPSPFDGATQHAPLRDGRSVLIADMIRAKLAREAGLLVAMQKLCWMRLLHRNHTRPEMSYGAESPAFPITVSPVQPPPAHLESEPPSTAGSRRSSVASGAGSAARSGASGSSGGSGGSGSSGGSAGPPREVVYQSIVLRIIKDCHALYPPSDATLSKHIHGLRDLYYREQLPSYQVFTETART